MIIIFNARWKSLTQKFQRGIPLTLSIENVDKEFWKWEGEISRWGILRPFLFKDQSAESGRRKTKENIIPRGKFRLVENSPNRWKSKRNNIVSHGEMEKRSI